MKIILDLDGVVWDIMHVFVDIYNSLFKENVKYKDIDGWWYFPYDKWKIVYPLTLPRIMEYPPVDVFIDHHLENISKGNEIVIITAEANPVGTLEEKLRSFKIYKGVHYKEIITVNPTESKLKYDADLYIDDNPNMAEEMINFPDKILLLYDQVWNKNFKTKGLENVWRVCSWDEIELAIILKIKYMK